MNLANPSEIAKANAQAARLRAASKGEPVARHGDAPKGTRRGSAPVTSTVGPTTREQREAMNTRDFLAAMAEHHGLGVSGGHAAFVNEDGVVVTDYDQREWVGKAVREEDAYLRNADLLAANLAADARDRPVLGERTTLAERKAAALASLAKMSESPITRPYVTPAAFLMDRQISNPTERERAEMRRNGLL